MKKGYDCNPLLPILCKYGTVVHCHHSEVQFNFYFVPRTTYFVSLTDSTVANVIRFVSKYPRHPAWHRFIESSNSFKLVRAASFLERAVLNLFDGICSKTSTMFWERIRRRRYSNMVILTKKSRFWSCVATCWTPSYSMAGIEKNSLLQRHHNYWQFLQRQWPVCH